MTPKMDPSILAASLQADKISPEPIIRGDLDMRIARDGTWFYHGSPIGRKPMVKLFASVLSRDEDGVYWLTTPVEKGRVEVDDAPFLAVELSDVGEGGEPALRFRTTLDDEVTADNDHPLRVALDPETGEPSPYVLVRGRLEALISRAGFYALVERGVIPFRTKAENVFGAGAEGMVVFNDVPGIFDGTLGRGFDREFDRPAVTISGEDGEALVATLENEQVNVRLRLVSEERPSRNVVASRPGSGDSIVIIGGHYDAVPGTPGAGDNASGTATFLVIAEGLADAGLPFELRVIGFGSEELGLLGSAAYIASLDEEEKSRIVAMFNYDALGAGELEIGGHFRLADRALEVASEIGTPAVRGIEIPGASSDHASFRDAGIPSMFFFGSDFSLIHSPLDTVDAMAPEMMGQAAAITLNGLLDGLADGLGE